jgi:carboxylesterase
VTRTPADDVHPVLPGAEAWSSPGGGPHGALVLHGFTGNPISVRPLAEALADAGFAVEMPRLPGHGTHVEDMIPTRLSDWLAEAERALGVLRARIPSHGQVVVAGLSMGGVLTVSLGIAHDDLAGLVCINSSRRTWRPPSRRCSPGHGARHRGTARERTPVELPPDMAPAIEALLESGQETMDSIGGDIADPSADEMSYDATPLRALHSMLAAESEIRPRLSEIRTPMLIVTSRQDHVVPPSNSDVLAEAVSGPVERLWLEESYHVATIDHDRRLVADAVVDFARRVAGG